jgi:hypothetical protein
MTESPGTNPSRPFHIDDFVGFPKGGPKQDAYSLAIIVQTTWRLYAKNGFAIAFFALTLDFLPTVFASVTLDATAALGISFSEGPHRTEFFSWQTVVFYVLATLSASFISNRMLATESGRSDTLRSYIALIVPSLLLALMIGASLFFALFLLVVPAIMLSVMWMVCVPVLVEEGLKVQDCPGRSMALTEGFRWRIFWLSCGLMAIGGIIYAAGIILGTVLFSITQFYGYLAIMPALLGAISSTLYSVVPVALYLHLLNIHEGPSRAELASMFD